MKNYISQLNGKEQNAIHCIKKLIANQLNPLIIYCFGCQTNVCIKRSAFVTRQAEEDRRFTCDLLVITPDGTVTDERKLIEIQEMTSHFGTVNMVIHPIGFVLRHMNEGNLFLNWVHREGMLLLDQHNSTRILPAPLERAYRSQAAAFYLKNPAMNNYLEVKLQPLIKAEGKKPVVSTQPIEIKLTLDSANMWQPVVKKG